MKIMYEKTKRNEIIDIIKGTGIILMVLRHARFPHSDYVLLFHMAIFFIASGYLYKKPDCDIRSIFLYIKKKIKTLWLPYFITNVVFVLLNNCFIATKIYTIDNLINTSIEIEGGALSTVYSLGDIIKSIIKAFFFQLNTHMGGATWFFGTLFGVLILYTAIILIVDSLKCTQRKKLTLRVLIAVMFSILGYICMINGYTLKGLNRVFTAFPLIEIGRAMNKYKLVEQHIKWRKVIGVFSLLLVVIGHEIGNISLASNQIVNPVFFIIMSISGWYILLNVAYCVVKIKKVKGICTNLSKNSIWIIGTHFLAFKLVSLIQIELLDLDFVYLSAFPVLVSGFMWGLLYTLVGLAMPMLLCKIYSVLKRNLICILN